MSSVVRTVLIILACPLALLIIMILDIEIEKTYNKIIEYDCFKEVLKRDSNSKKIRR